jgi:hypothetical protein
MRDEIPGYGANAAYKYFPITQKHYYNGSEFTQNQKFWTLTLHTATCRFAKFDRNNHLQFDYPGQGGLTSLAQYGTGAPSKITQGTVWLGCKTCGTANLSKAEWQHKAQRQIAAERAADAARRAERDAEDQIEKAQDARKRAIQDARIAWIKAHETEIAAVEQAAAEQWEATNPELLALIGAKGGAQQ